MSDRFEISAVMTKKELIDQHTRLLAEYHGKVAEAKELEKRLSEAQKHQVAAVVKAAQGTSVEGVLESLGQLRSQTGKALTELTEKMVAQAERLEQLNGAIATQERRLKELHEIEAAADSLAKLTAAWQERSQGVDKEFAARLAELERSWNARVSELERSHGEKKSALEADYAGRKENLAAEIEATRAAWKAEQERQKKDAAEDKAEQKKSREREEAEYLYSRDRTRKLEEHEYAERRTLQEKEIKELKATVEKVLAERETAVQARESELAELRKKVEAFPQTLGGELDRARKEVAAAAAREHKQEMASVELERKWEKKVLEERIKHLETTIAAQDAKVDELKADLASAVARVQQIADKAVEGASLNRAFQSVNQIALEQARRPDQKGKE